MPKGHWSIEKVIDNEDLWVKGQSAGFLSICRPAEGSEVECLDPVTTMLIWTLPVINIEEITEDNADEVFIRIRMLETAREPLLRADAASANVSFANILRRVGLLAIPDLTMDTFENVILKILRGKARTALDDERESFNEAARPRE